MGTKHATQAAPTQAQETQAAESYESCAARYGWYTSASATEKAVINRIFQGSGMGPGEFWDGAETFPSAAAFLETCAAGGENIEKLVESVNAERAQAPAGKESAQGPAPGLHGENVGETAQESALLALLETMRPLAQVAESFRSTIPAALWEIALAQESAAAAQAQAAAQEKKLAALAQALGLNAQLHGAILAQFAVAQPARAAAIWQAAGLLETLPSGRGRRAKPAPVVPAETLAQYTAESWAKACLASGKNAWGLERGTLRHAYCLLVAQHTATGGISVKAIQHRVGAVRPQNNITREMASAANATATLPARPAFVERVNGLVRATSAGLAAWAAYLALTNGAA